MIWLKPWAWLGLAGVALPVLIHLLARGHAPAHRFPSLRFLDASRLLPTRRTRVHDPMLLAVRCGVIVLAVAALSQPLLVTAARRRSLDRGLARAIIVDTSASMRRMAPSGGRAIDTARIEARSLATAQVSMTIESNDPARAVPAASAWLASQSRRAELVVLSDFQRGQLDSIDIVAVPKGVGVSLRRMPVVDTAGIETQATAGDARVVARTTLVGERTNVEWVSAGPMTHDGIVLLGADTDRIAVSATCEAAATRSVPLPLDSARAVAIVFPTYADRAALQAAARPTYAPWMVDLFANVEAARRDGRGLSPGTVPFRPTVSAFSGVANVGGRQRLILFADSTPGSFASARMAAMALRATSVAPATRELEPETLPDAALAALQRPPSNDGPTQLHPTDENGPSDARWLWAGALALLLVEWLVRRRQRVESLATTVERVHAA